jgi:hypothetical protein
MFFDYLPLELVQAIMAETVHVSGLGPAYDFRLVSSTHYASLWLRADLIAYRAFQHRDTTCHIFKSEIRHQRQLCRPATKHASIHA